MRHTKAVHFVCSVDRTQKKYEEEKLHEMRQQLAHELFEFLSFSRRHFFLLSSDDKLCFIGESFNDQ